MDGWQEVPQLGDVERGAAVGPRELSCSSSGGAPALPGGDVSMRALFRPLCCPRADKVPPGALKQISQVEQELTR